MSSSPPSRRRRRCASGGARASRAEDEEAAPILCRPRHDLRRRFGERPCRASYRARARVCGSDERSGHQRYIDSHHRPQDRDRSFGGSTLLRRRRYRATFLGRDSGGHCTRRRVTEEDRKEQGLPPYTVGVFRMVFENGELSILDAHLRVGSDDQVPRQIEARATRDRRGTWEVDGATARHLGSPRVVARAAERAFIVRLEPRAEDDASPARRTQRSGRSRTPFLAEALGAWSQLDRNLGQKPSTPTRQALHGEPAAEGFDSVGETAQAASPGRIRAADRRRPRSRRAADRRTG